MNPKKELLWGLWVNHKPRNPETDCRPKLKEDVGSKLASKESLGNGAKKGPLTIGIGIWGP